MFKKSKQENLPEVSTASLPDIVFMLLFFFMTVTVMKSDVLMVENTLPNASEVKKMQHKDRIIYIHIGKPSEQYRKLRGEESLIQINDKFAYPEEVGDFVLMKLAEMPQSIRAFTTVSLKVDKNANMGLVADVKLELRKVNALKINYTTYEGDAFKNQK
ncbi:MAG: biopolymer transporter ExbD [Cellulophaga sp.]